MTELAEAFAAATGQDYAAKTPWNDAGLRSHQRMAARFAQYAEGKCIYVVSAGWHFWSGTRWAPDDKGARAYEVLGDLLKLSYAESMQDKDLAADVRGSMSAQGTKGVLELALRRMLVKDIDADPYLLNCTNGTLDLRTLELRPHDPSDMITKVTRCAYNPAATSSDWDQFLESSLPNENVRSFLQRFAGSSLVGKVLDHVLVIATGGGRNGKGVLARAFSNALGDYAITASNNMLISSRHGQKSAGEQASQMRLRGARWAVMSELEKGDKLAESTMKSLTGGDTIEAKFMGQDPVEFMPSHSFFMLTNDLPKVDADAKAVWARLRVVPFDVSFEGKEDSGLEERLELCLEAILAWAVLGLAGYQDEGLAAPNEVLAAGEHYRAENDTVQQFITDCCALSPQARVTRSELHHSYLEWARENGAQQFTPREFTPKIRARPGVSDGKKAGGYETWQGISIKA